MKLKFLFTLAVLSTLFSCSENAILDEYQDLPDSGWTQEQELIMEFEITDTTTYYQFYSNLRLNADYPYSNIHLLMSTISPDSTISKEIISVKLAEKSGKWLGSGIGNVITFQEPFPNRKMFKQAGTYTVKLSQYMRLETVEHVQSAGIKIIQQEQIL
ncbi:MAG: gliding motility lipoprotein GldH [Bacteroidia bacterium]